MDGFGHICTNFLSKMLFIIISFAKEVREVEICLIQMTVGVY